MKSRIFWFMEKPDIAKVGMVGNDWEKLVSRFSAMLLDKYQFVLDIFSLFNDISDLFFPLYVIVLGVAVGYLLWTALFTEPDSTPAVKVYGFKSKTELLQWKKSFVGSWEVVTRNGFCEVGALSIVSLLISYRYFS